MHMLYIFGASQIIALILWFVLPGLSMWSVLLAMAAALLVLWLFFVLSIELANIVTQFQSPLLGTRDPETRMTKEEVMALAAQVCEKARIYHVLGWPSVCSVNGRLTWIVCTPTEASGWTVCIDDATGTAEPMRRSMSISSARN
jgi:hypothetical protein